MKYYLASLTNISLKNFFGSTRFFFRYRTPHIHSTNSTDKLLQTVESNVHWTVLRFIANINCVEIKWRSVNAIVDLFDVVSVE